MIKIRLQQFTFLLLMCLSMSVVAQQSNERTVVVHQTTENNGSVNYTEQSFVLPEDVSDVMAFLEEQGIDLSNLENTKTKIMIKQTGEDETDVNVDEMIQHFLGEDADININVDELNGEVKKFIWIDDGDGEMDIDTNNEHFKAFFDLNEVDANDENRPFLGVFLGYNVQNINGTTNKQVKIEGVMDGGAAKEAGIQEGDIVKALDDQDMNEVDSFTDYLANKTVGDVVNITVERDGEEMVIPVTLKAKSETAGTTQAWNKSNCDWSKCDLSKYDSDWIAQMCPDGWYPGCCDLDANKALMGVVVENSESSHGASVKKVNADGAAAESTLQINDVITQIDQTPVKDADELLNALAKYSPGDKVKVTYDRNGKTKKTKVTLKGRKAPAVEKAHRYYNLSDKEDTKIVRLTEEDLERLLNGEEVKMQVADQETDKLTDEISIQLEDDVTIDCPEFKVIITQLEDQDIETIKKYDDAVDMDSMSELEVINLNLYPNPNDGLFELNFRLQEDKPVMIRIVSLTGKEVYRQDLGNFEGTYSSKIDLSDKSAGVYVLQIVQEDRMMTRKIVIE